MRGRSSRRKERKAKLKLCDYILSIRRRRKKKGRRQFVSSFHDLISSHCLFHSEWRGVLDVQMYEKQKTRCKIGGIYSA